MNSQRFVNLERGQARENRNENDEVAALSHSAKWRGAADNLIFQFSIGFSLKTRTLVND